jgi:hypothetical protein
MQIGFHRIVEDRSVLILVLVPTPTPSTRPDSQERCENLRRQKRKVARTGLGKVAVEYDPVRHDLGLPLITNECDEGQEQEYGHGHRNDGSLVLQICKHLCS